jgi:aryl-alcohol dehydrogenase-like predicted oxidoreductase
MIVKRPLGAGLLVSEIALGTVELGMDYGFRGTDAYRKPGRRAAISLVRSAVDRGINLIDTAPAYGESERIIGEVLHNMPTRPLIATKMTMPSTIENSLRALRLEAVDFLQIHNATPETLRSPEVLRVLEEAITTGKVRFTGASVYDVESARMALDNPLFRLLQLPFNLLDQKMFDEVIPRASAAGVAVLVRSAFLRGVLAGAAVPPQLATLQQAACAALQRAQGSVTSMAELALRFCLSVSGISSVLIGVRSEEELEQNVAAAARGPLEPALVDELRACSLGDDPLVNPMNWQGLI